MLDYSSVVQRNNVHNSNDHIEIVTGSNSSYSTSIYNNTTFSGKYQALVNRFDHDYMKPLFGGADISNTSFESDDEADGNVGSNHSGGTFSTHSDRLDPESDEQNLL
jgi:hypothetical protein